MTPASRSAAKATTAPSPSWAFSESFITDDDTMRLARPASRQLAPGAASQAGGRVTARSSKVSRVWEIG